MFVFNYRSSDVDMELKKGFFLNIRAQGKLMMLRNENILAWITRIKFSIKLCLFSLLLYDVFPKVIGEYKLSCDPSTWPVTCSTEYLSTI
jgi:hypothetical protein